MPVTLKSSEVQQHFGRVVDRALVEDDVVVERYGEPRVVIIGYERYRHLLEAESALVRQSLVPPNTTEEAQARGRRLAAQIRDELKESMSGSLEETMASLRGRSWS